MAAPRSPPHSDGTGHLLMPLLRFWRATGHSDMVFFGASIRSFPERMQHAFSGASLFDQACRDGASRAFQDPTARECRLAG